jgi:2-polyprenyl-3-methyl-5-hydroxy-6-metoxy-1,4-benzoquinol methylase
MDDACCACGGAEIERRVGVNHMKICTDCGMGRIPGEPMMHSYWTQEDPDETLNEVYWEARRRMFRNALDYLERSDGPGKVLDLGGGAGHFAEIALGLGWDAYSSDLSGHAALHAAHRVGVERSLRSTEAPELSGTFDAVTVWCVVAHVQDPVALLQEAARLLKPGGKVLITTPNFLFQKVYARLLDRIGRPLDFRAQDHLLNFTPKSLQLIGAKAGLSDFSFHYFGVTEECLMNRNLGSLLVPLKKAWNMVGVRTTLLGLPPMGAELHLIANRR